MADRRWLVAVGVALGGLAWWLLRPVEDGPTETDGAAVPERARPTERSTDRPPLPTRTDADLAPARPPVPDGERPPPPEPTDRPHVTCRLSASVMASQGALYLVYGDQEILVDTPTAANQMVSFVFQPRYRHLVLHLPGFAPVPFEVDAKGTCLSEPLQLEARVEPVVTGVVLNTAGNPEPEARVRGCGPARVGGDGRFRVLPVRAPCTLQAIRQDGFWYSRSAAVEITGDAEVELVLNEYPRGGMGVGVALTDGGVQISDVHPGSPGEGAGLSAGEVIVAVEGEPTADMALDEFVDRATGEAGTDVTLTVLGVDGAEREITLTRAMLGP